MPIYEYECARCGTVEANSPRLEETECPQCPRDREFIGLLRRIFSVPAVHNTPTDSGKKWGKGR